MNPERLFKGQECSYMMERKTARPCPCQHLLTFPMFSRKSIYAAPFLALAPWRNTSLLTETQLLFAEVCKHLWQGLQRRGERERTPQEYLHKGRALKAQVWVVSSDTQVFKVFSLMSALAKQGDPVWGVPSFASVADFCTRKGIWIISVIKERYCFSFCTVNSNHPRLTSAFYLSCHKFLYFC